MVKAKEMADPGMRSAERALALTYAPAELRPALSALLGLDEALGAILRSTREPLVGQIRLAWWRDALTALDSRPAPAEPMLQALGREVIPRGVTEVTLADMIDGWEALLVEPLDESALRAHAVSRGGGLFAAAAAVLGGDAIQVRRAGEGWALADVAANLSDTGLAREARDAARETLAAALTIRWPRALRPLGALAWIARMDLSPSARPPGHPARVWRLLRFRLTGR